jgi:hypothetical protein
MITRKNIALAVGINRYQNVRALGSATHDARDIGQVIGAGSIPSEVKLLIDAEATKPAIIQGLEWLAAEANSENTALVFFSGHGWRTSPDAETAYFCPFEASPSDLDQTCVTNREFTEALRAIKSSRLVVLLDTCHAGAIGEPRNCLPFPTTSLAQSNIESLVQGKGRVILAASRPEELAWELAGMHNGLFTSFVLRALRGAAARADGTIWISDVFSYVSRHVLEFGHQHTYQKAIGEDFVVMFQDPASTIQTTFALGGHFDQRALRRQMHSAFNRAELDWLCHDLGLKLEDLPGTTLETQILGLIDHCYRHGLYDRLLQNFAWTQRHSVLTG